MRSIEKILDIYLLFGILFIIYVLLNIQGFDVTDFGYHFTNQYSLQNYPIDTIYFSPLYLLSDIAGGLWLSLIGFPSVLWAKIGGALLYATCACIVYSILVKYFDKIMVFCVVLISTLFLTMGNSCYIHYFTFPAFLILGELWIFNVLLLSNPESNKYKIFGFLLGFLLIPIILSRITLVLILLIPIAFSIFLILKKENLDEYKRLVFYAIIGVFSSLIIFTCVYVYLGIFTSSMVNILSIFSESASGNVTNFSESHTMASLIYSYLIDYNTILIRTGIIVFGLFFISYIKEKTGNLFASILLLFIPLTGILFIFISDNPFDFFSTNILKVTIGLILLLTTLFFFVDKGKNRNLSLLLIAGAIIMIISPIGSDTGVVKSLYGFWFILPLSLLCAYQIRTSIKYPRISSILSMTPVILIALLIVAIFFQSVNIYRDDPNRMNLNEGFSHPSLFGIYSTDKRVKVVDELLIAIEDNSQNGDELLMVNAIPMFYYLTETKPALGNPWLFLEPIEMIKLEQKKLENERRYPKLLVISKVNTLYRYWPEDSPITVQNPYVEKTQYIKSTYINDLNYSLLWENEAFEIYNLPDS
ncbi:hypothetical protein [Methanogenium organophilum]|uniref:Uncharacterized protein n=1 Tax=Methanogenium organophilum TaxID=2199 RepID=A0A9X9S3Q3_METOG|nr:hypothetical protein [Methanogenium organophilum]WAI01187.1 hypothetical protein OU421_12360 [Methanogenium organophilum]